MIKNPRSIIRLMVGLVFLSEGVQKFLFPDSVGTGRFAAVGVPLPEYTAYLVATIEVLCGALLIIAKYVREVCWPLLVVMAGAFYFTKLPILANQGFWEMAHAIRTDFAMVCGMIFLLLTYPPHRKQLIFYRSGNLKF